MSIHPIQTLWGKTDRKNPDNFHPLIFHLLDVGHCAKIIWEQGLSASIRQRIANALGLSVEEAGNAVALLAGLHDLGKACPPFQAKVDWLAEKVSKAGLLIPKSDLLDKPHGMVSAKEIARLLQDNQFLWSASENSAIVLAGITGGHHGSFPKTENIISMGANTLGSKEWQEIRNLLANDLARLLNPKLMKIRTETLTGESVVSPRCLDSIIIFKSVCALELFSFISVFPT